VRVTSGQQVSRGDVLGLIGTSGNSSAPHLHFQAMTAPTFFPTDSPPYVFDHFDLVGQVTERIWDDIIGLQPTGTLPYEAAPDAGARTSQMPLDRNVIRVTTRH
jgi:murein DD-endopeptidase MepM/ murein hydrolase activator NlpD